MTGQEELAERLCEVVWPDYKPEFSSKEAAAILGDHGVFLPDGRDSLDVAWQEAEAALPEGWQLEVWSSPTGSGWRHAAAVPPQGRFQRRVSAGGLDMSAAATLHALTLKLREVPR